MTSAPRDILNLRMNGTTPVLRHPDGINDRLREARAMLVVLEQAFRTAAEVDGRDGIGTITDLNPTIIADAIEGVASMLAYAQFHHDHEGD